MGATLGKVSAGAACIGTAVVLSAAAGMLSRAAWRRFLWLDPEKWPLDEWIDKHHEEAVDPHLEIIDPHHHLWDPCVHPKGWPIPRSVLRLMYFMNSPAGVRDQIHADLRAKKPELLRLFSARQLPFMQPYMAGDLRHDVNNRGCGKQAHNVVKTVYVECGWKEGSDETMWPLGEVRMAGAERAKMPGVCDGVVAFADLRRHDVERLLRAYSEIPSVKGVRQALAYAKDVYVENAEGMARQEDFRRGFALLEKYGLSYDTWCFHLQLPEFVELARDFPNTTIILDHVGLPIGIGDQPAGVVFAQWTKDMRALAASSSNVHVKLSGLNMPVVNIGFDRRDSPPTSKECAAAWSPYFKVCLEAFGTERCMFASNFPVDKVSCDYTVLWNAFKLIVQDYSERDKRLLFYDNARRVYRL